MAITDKVFRHRVYQEDGTIVGELLDVASDISFKQDIDKVLGAMDITLGRNDQVREETVTDIHTESDESLTAEDDNTLLADIAAAIGLGEASTVDLNLDYRLTAYYGEYVELVTQSNEEILLENDEEILVEDGAPGGKDLFTGYISKWETGFGDNEETEISVLSHSNELNNIMLQTEDTILLNYPMLFSEEYLAQSPYRRYAQTFTAPSTTTIDRVDIYANNYSGVVQQWVCYIVAGTPTAPGATIATIVKDIYPTSGFEAISFIASSAVSITNGTVYHILLDKITSGSHAFDLATSPSNPYLGGSFYIWDGAAWANYAGSDMGFRLMLGGGVTTVPFNNMDPAYIMRSVVDFAKSRGARLTYDSSTIESTGTTVSYTFKANTIREAMEKILDLCPADWYMRYDFGSNEMHLHPRPNTPDDVISLGKDIEKLTLTRSMEKMVNDVYFTGGGNPALYKRTTDSASQSAWRKALKKISDNRVTSSEGGLTTAGILSQAEIDRNSEPIYSAKGTITNTDRDLEDYFVGMLLGFSGFGNFIDDLELQLVSLTYRAEVLDVTLGALLPQTPYRVEELRRILDSLENQNNPASPS